MIFGQTVEVGLPVLMAPLFDGIFFALELHRAFVPARIDRLLWMLARSTSPALLSTFLTDHLRSSHQELGSQTRSFRRNGD